MKKITLIAAMFCVTAISAQVYMNSKFWSVALNAGGHMLHSHMNANTVKFYQPSQLHVNGHYKFNHVFGIRPNFNFHNLKMDDKNVKYAHFAIDGTVDFNQLGTYGFREQLYEISVLGHLGVGLSTMWKDRTSTGDPGIKGNDDMITFSLGVTPRMRISKNMLINFDVTYVTHALQDRYFDFSDRKARGFGGGFMRYSVGITYEFIR